MKIAVATDHAGFPLKDKVLETVRRYEATQGVLWAPAPLLVERAQAGRGWNG